MTFLELLTRLCVECDIPHDTLTDVTDVSGEIAQARGWLVDAWKELQGDLEWTFMRVSSSWNLAQYSQVLAPPEWTTGIVRSWDETTFRLAPPSPQDYQHSVPIDLIEWPIFMQTRLATTWSYGRPSYITIRDPDAALLVNPAPDVTGYVLYYDYIREPQELLVNTDVPIIPVRSFDMLLVYEAMVTYGYAMAAPEALANAKRLKARLRGQMRQRFGPRIRFGSWS